MFRKIVIASDSFKGSLTSAEVAEAATLGIHETCPECIVETVCIADGGEGTAKILTDALNGTMVSAMVHDPLGRPIEASYGIHADSDGVCTAVMEMAQASGLPLLEVDERNPLLTSTYGTGEMIADAIGRGCRRFLIGIGGSATNDGGTGMLEALGFRFIGKDGKALQGCCGGILADIAKIDDCNALPELKESEFIIACDVESVFYGPDGATRVFSAQKGADSAMTEKLEKGMVSFAGVILKQYGIDLSETPGSGAAGGLGGAFLAFTKASLRSGIEMVLDACGFDDMLEGADLVITGEGKIDSQTNKGKAISGVMRRAGNASIPVVALCGICALPETEDAGFRAILPICPPPSDEIELTDAMNPATAFGNVRKTVSEYLRLLSSGLE